MTTPVRPLWLRVVFYVLVGMAAYGYGVATGRLIGHNDGDQPRVELVCHPIEGAADGARACVTP